MFEKSTEFTKNMINNLSKDDQKVVLDMLDRDLEENHEWYEKMTYAEKPDALKLRDSKLEDSRKGLLVDRIDNILPIKDEILVETDSEQDYTESGIVIKQKQWRQSVIVKIIKIGRDTTLEAEEGDMIVIHDAYFWKQNWTKSKRLYYNGKTYLLIKKEHVLGVLYDR